VELYTGVRRAVGVDKMSEREVGSRSMQPRKLLNSLRRVWSDGVESVENVECRLDTYLLFGLAAESTALRIGAPYGSATFLDGSVTFLAARQPCGLWPSLAVLLMHCEQSD
jgi:hypothetical protein